MRPQLWHIIVLLVVILLVFGASRLPDIARNLGKSAKVLKEEIKDLRDDEPVPPAQQPPVQQGYQAPNPTAGYGDQAGPYSPGGTTPPGVTSPTPPPSTTPEWPPGTSQR